MEDPAECEEEEKEEEKKINIENIDSLISEDGLLRSFLKGEEAKTLESTIKYIKENPEFDDRLMSKINGLDSSKYELALNSTIEELNENSDNQELIAIRDTLIAGMHSLGMCPLKKDEHGEVLDDGLSGRKKNSESRGAR